MKYYTGTTMDHLLNRTMWRRCVPPVVDRDAVVLIELRAKYDIRGASPEHHLDAQHSWNYDADRQKIVQMPRRWLLLPGCKDMRMMTIIIKVIFSLLDH